MIGAEPAIIDAFIGWFNMKIVIVICEIIVMPSPDYSCKQTQKRQIGFFIKNQTLFTDIRMPLATLSAIILISVSLI